MTTARPALTAPWASSFLPIVHLIAIVLRFESDRGPRGALSGLIGAWPRRREDRRRVRAPRWGSVSRCGHGARPARVAGLGGFRVARPRRAPRGEAEREEAPA